VLFETTGFIFAIRFSPRGDAIAFIAQPSSTNLAVVDLVDLRGAVKELATGLLYARGLAWRPDGEEVWFSSGSGDASPELRAVTRDGRGRLLLREAAELHIQDISKDGRVLATVSNFSGEMKVRGPGDREETDVTWLDYTWLDTLSADGRTLLFDEIGGGGGKGGGIYLRKISEPSAVRMGEGTGLDLSPDGAWVLATVAGDTRNLVLVPTGPGQPRPLGKSEVDVSWAKFLPDGSAIVAKASMTGRPERLYLRSLSSTEWKPVSAEGLTAGPIAISADGRVAAAPGPDGILLCPLDGGASHTALGSRPGEVPVAFRPDGRALYAYKRSAVPALVYRLDLTIGQRELWKEIAPADRNGVYRVDAVAMARDGQAYAYSYGRRLGRLIVLDGLK